MTASDLPLTDQAAATTTTTADGARRRGPLGQFAAADAETEQMAKDGFTVERSGLFGLTRTYRASDQLREQIAAQAAAERLPERAAHVARMHANVCVLHYAATGQDLGEAPDQQQVAERLAALRPQ